MGHLYSFLRNNKTLALRLTSSIGRRVILSVYKLGLFTFSSAWIGLLRQRHQLRNVRAIILQQLGLVWNVLKRNRAGRYVHSLSGCATYNLSCTACLAAVILTLKVWLLNSAMRTCVFFGNLIQNSSNRALSCVVFLLSSTLVNFSHWRRALALRVTQDMRGYMRLLVCQKLLKYLLWLFWTDTLLSC